MAEPGGRVRVFVYGTLKLGFPNAHRGRGRRLPGRYITRQALPLYVVRLPDEDRAPWLMHLPGQGHRVCGELVEIDAAELPALDRFEEVGLPGGYQRVALELDPLAPDAAPAAAPAGPPLLAQAYLKPAHQLGAWLAAEGPFGDYTPDLARGYWLRVNGEVLAGTPPPDPPDPPG